MSRCLGFSNLGFNLLACVSCQVRRGNKREIRSQGGGCDRRGIQALEGTSSNDRRVGTPHEPNCIHEEDPIRKRNPKEIHHLGWRPYKSSCSNHLPEVRFDFAPNGPPILASYRASRDEQTRCKHRRDNELVKEHAPKNQLKLCRNRSTKRYRDAPLQQLIPVVAEGSNEEGAIHAHPEGLARVPWVSIFDALRDVVRSAEHAARGGALDREWPFDELSMVPPEGLQKSSL